MKKTMLKIAKAIKNSWAEANELMYKSQENILS